MKAKFSLLLSFSLLIAAVAFSQDTLPNFSVRNAGPGKVQVSWFNRYENLVQLTVQRSFDSTAYFRTIYSAQSPQLPQNGFIDNSVPVGYKVYYRIQYVFDGGEYHFTPSKGPSAGLDKIYYNTESTRVKEGSEQKEKIKEVAKNPTSVEARRDIRIYRRSKDSLIAVIDYVDYKKFRDSIVQYTKDTIFFTTEEEVLIKPYIAKPVWKPSVFVYTNNNGYLTISLPQALQHNYRIVFFEENGTELFQIKKVKETELTLDKANFIHAGWFYFELYEGDKLKEKNKFYLDKDF